MKNKGKKKKKKKERNYHSEVEFTCELYMFNSSSYLNGRVMTTHCEAGALDSL